MTCKQVILFFDSHEGNTLPKEVAEHLAGCERCREEFERLREVLAVMQRMSELRADDDFTRRVMTVIRSEAEATANATRKERRPARLIVWIAAGVLLLVGMPGLRFSRWMVPLRSAFGPSVDLAMTLILGLALTGYLCLLVASNFEKISRFVRRRTS
jgi:predicted anti-sigma-YlaC factor YlaD